MARCTFWTLNLQSLKQERLWMFLCMSGITLWCSLLLPACLEGFANDELPVNSRRVYPVSAKNAASVTGKQMACSVFFV
jgi:hypothetical protein